MGNEMSIELRKHKRFQGKDGAFVTLRRGVRKLWQIIDISQNGLAFRYLGQVEGAPASLELDIITGDTAFYIEKIPFTIVSDCEIANQSLSDYTARRCGVEFRELAPSQRSQLEYFIRNYTNGGG